MPLHNLPKGKTFVSPIQRILKMTGFFDKPTLFIITGASSAIGAELAGQVVAGLGKGSCVLLTSRSLQRLQGLGLPSDGRLRLELAEVDLSQPSESLFSSLLDKAGDPSQFTQAVLVHNAAALGDMGRRVADMADKDELYEQLNVNLVSTLLLTSAFLKRFAKAQRYLVNMTAPSATNPRPSFGLTSMVKAPRQLLMRILALEEPDVKRTSRDLKVISFDPVAVDSHALQSIRDTSHDQGVRDLIRGLYDAGKVLPVERVAGAILGFLASGAFHSGDVKRATDFPQAAT